jgi:hypothetical protein
LFNEVERAGHTKLGTIIDIPKVLQAKLVKFSNLVSSHFMSQSLKLPSFNLMIISLIDVHESANLPLDPA